MQSDSVRRLPRLVLAVIAAALAVVAATGMSVFGASPAHATQASPASPAIAAADLTLGLSPSSGSDYGTDHATLSWSALPTACVGQELDVFLYKGTGPWNADAINVAEGNPPEGSGQQTYFNFFSNSSAPATALSTDWPNVPAGYQDFGFSSGVVFASTAALVTAKGTGLYTIGVGCVNNSTFAPITDGSGNPIAGSILVNLGASGQSWAVSAAASTSIALTGSGTAKESGSGTAALTAAVTSAGGVPAGGVNFYAGGSAAGTPLNGSTPVAVGSNGHAQYSGPSGYAASVLGQQSYTAKFVPASPAAFTGSSVTANVDLILDNVTIKVAVKPDPGSATSVDVTATATGSPLNNLSTVIKGGGVEVVIGGKVVVVSSPTGTLPELLLFNSSNVATGKVTGLKPGTHAVTAQLANTIAGRVAALGPDDGFTFTASTANVKTAPFATKTTVVTTLTSRGLLVTATVADPAGITATPAGTVAFKDGTTSLGSATLKASKAGSATAVVTDFSVPAGVNHFTATYAPVNKAQFASSTGTSVLTQKKATNWVRSGSPAISGKAAVGDKLTAKPGKWGPAGVHLSFKWLANGSAISHATGTTLVLAAAQLGKKITVQVTGSKKGFVTVEVTSPPTAKVVKGGH
jgi:hypothetical protein